MPNKWWETIVFYQIYPRSFADTNNDGVGDIPGIIGKLDYLDWLGVKGIWLSPHYPSPQVDVGYDIADYTDVEPDYGTLVDFERMLAEIHKRDMKLILDLVLNHTSDQHRWFQESRSSKDNPKRDWYIWRDGVDGGPPNNWESEFGGPAWTYDEHTGQWYYHYFLKEQPDLNWRNPDLKAAMFDATRFWLDMGVDGFRLDALSTLFEDPDLTPHHSSHTAIDILRRRWVGEPDDGVPFTALVSELFNYQLGLPEAFDLIRAFRVLVDQYDDRFLVGETVDTRLLGMAVHTCTASLILT
jgi:alpha-glucosidase